MNTRGRLVSDRLAWFEVVVGFDEMSENTREWVGEGYQLIAELRAAMHGILDPRGLESGPSSAWLKYGRWIDKCARAEGAPSLDGWLRSFGSGTVGAHPSPPEGGWPDEAEEEVDIDRLLEYWREHRHEYLDHEEQKQPPPRSALLDASERLDEHITDVPFEPEFRSVLRASAAAGYGALQRFEADRFEPDVQPGPQTRALLEAWRSPAAADRAVRTAAWLVFGAAIGLLLGIDRRQEAVDAASVAIPLSPVDLSWVLDHVDDCFRWMQESDVETQVIAMTTGETPDIDAMMGEWGAPVTLNSWTWLCDAVLQREPRNESPPLDDDTITWGLELAVAMFDDLNDIWAGLEDARGAG